MGQRTADQGEEPSQRPGGATDAQGDAGSPRLAEENERLRAENDALRTKAAPRRPRRRRLRKSLTALLVVLVTVSVVASTAGFWVHRTLSNEDRYVALVAPLARDPAVTGALGTKLTDAVFVALDVQHRVEQALASIPRLPPQAEFLAGPITSGVRSLIQRAVQNFLASEAFVNLWTEVNRTAHAKVKALLNGDYDQLPNVSIDGGEVRLSLVSMVAQVLQRVVQRGADGLGLNVTVPDIPAGLGSSAAVQKLGSALGVTLPADYGQVTVMTEEQLTGYQKALQQAKRLLGVMFIVTLILIAATILVSTHRRRAVMWLGLSIVAGLFLAGVFLRRVQADIVDRIKGPGGRAAAHDVFAQVTGGLRRIGLLVIVFAVVAALVAHLAGRPGWLKKGAASTKRLLERRPEGSRLEVWVAANATAVRIGSITTAVVLLFITGLNWVSVGVVGFVVVMVLWGVVVAQHRVESRATPAPTMGTPGA